MERETVQVVYGDPKRGMLSNSTLVADKASCARAPAHLP